jgi:CelD/BcsL family acetyltransferase involved in cellulose biosynthesis
MFVHTVPRCEETKESKMALPHIVRFQSISALRNAADDWNDLWQRSGGALPTGRAELIADWLEQFAPHAKFTALAVEQDGQLVAGLPLMERRVAKFIKAGSPPANSHSWAGELLVDQTTNVQGALSALSSEFRNLPWPLLWFDMAPLELSSWRPFLAALEEHGFSHRAHNRFQIGTIQIVERFHRDWEAYEAAWSGNHRRHLRKALRRAESEGGVKLELVRPDSTADLDSLLRSGFEVEHRSWKGAAGSSVLSDPAMWQFYLRQAKELARHGELELAFLRHAGRAIAFEYGWSSRGIYYTPKVGFDGEYSRFSPGQLLRYLLLKNAFSRPDRLAVDFLGPLSEATAKWTTRTYPISRLVVATNAIGKMHLWSYQTIAAMRRQLRRRKMEAADLKIISTANQVKSDSAALDSVPLSANGVDA